LSRRESEFGLDVPALRADTPGCEEVVHLNNAGAALMPRPVVQAICGQLEREARVGGYEAAATDPVAAVHEEIAGLVGATPGEIALTDSATRAWNTALLAVPFEPGDRVLVSRLEYGSNFISLLKLREARGVRIEVVPSEASGAISVDALESMMDDDVRLISLTHVPTHGGLVNPAEAVGRVARRWRCLYLLDACQSMGQMSLDVDRVGCDMLTATGRKFLRGPRGTGFLYVRQKRIPELDPPMPDMRAATWVEADRYELAPDARRFESWEHSVALALGLGEAVRYARTIGIEAIGKRIRFLAEGLRDRLDALPGATVRDQGQQRCGIVTFTLEGSDPESLVFALRKQGINLSVSVPETSRMDLEARGLGRLFRASVHAYNTEAELDRLVVALKGLAGHQG